VSFGKKILVSILALVIIIIADYGLLGVSRPSVEVMRAVSGLQESGPLSHLRLSADLRSSPVSGLETLSAVPLVGVCGIG